MSTVQRMIKELEEEGLWISGHERSLREKLFHALYVGPVEEEKEVE